MHAIDFYYDGRKLSDYGFIICRFDGDGGTEIVSAGTKPNFNTVPKRRGERHSLINISFESGATREFDICKCPDDFDDLMITDEEYQKLTRWLCRADYRRLYIIDDELDLDRRYYNATFTVDKIYVADTLYGLRLTVVSERPYAVGERQYFNYTFSGSSSDYAYLYDYSGRVASFVPDMEITCLEAGNLTISNELTGSAMMIKGCAQNEVITINGDTLQISTSNNSHNVWDDFNYDFLKIGNTFENRNNRLTANLNCTVDISYDPVIIDAP